MPLLYPLILLLSCGVAFSAPKPASVDPHVFRILTRTGKDEQPVSGTGFAIRGSQVLVTNYHVVDGAKEIMVLKFGNEEVLLPAQVLKASRSHDIALLVLTDGLSDAGLLLSPRSEAVKGQAVWAVGYPGAADRGRIDLNAVEPTLTQGIVNRTLYQPWEESGPVLAIVQHDAKLSQGNSGGPLVDACGQVVGVNTQIALAEQTLVTYDYALGVAELRSLLDSWGIAYQNASAPCVPVARSPVEPLVWWSIGLAVLLAAAALILALRGPRQRLARVVESYSRYRHGAPRRNRKEGKPRNAGTGGLPQREDGWVMLTLRRDSGEVICVLRCPASQFHQWVIGRSTALCDQVIDDDTVSRRHARIFWEPQRGQWFVEDLNSSNGTWLDGGALPAFEPKLLRQGVRLTLGELQLVVPGQ